MQNIFRIALLMGMLQSVCSCAPAKPPSNAGAAVQRGPIQFTLVQLGPRAATTMTFKVSLYNASDRELYVSVIRPEFDWIRTYAVSHMIRLGEGEVTGVSVRPSLLSIERPVCPEPNATFAIAKGETLSRVIKLEIPEAHRSSRKLTVLVDLEVPVFDATLSCREKPWVSGTAETVIE
jgi:hypothetical protein